MAEKLNILFLGGAKRVSIARMFVEAAKREGYDCGIISYELTERVPIASVGKVAVGLRWSDPEIYDDLDKVVAAHGVKVIIPFVDPAVAIAARYAERRPSIFSPVSAHHLADAMHDKLIASDLFEQARLPQPQRYIKGRPQFPLIAKPRSGSASKGIVVVKNAVEFRSVVSRASDYLIQEYFPRRQEYTVDCYVSRAGRICCCCPRLRLEVSGGEVMRTVTVDEAEVAALARDAINRLGLLGAVTVQILRDLDTGLLMMMEINPRLGGGAVCSVHAGCDIPGMIIREALGREVAEAFPKPGVEIARYMQEVVFWQ